MGTSGTHSKFLRAPHCRVVPLVVGLFNGTVSEVRTIALLC